MKEIRVKDTITAKLNLHAVDMKVDNDELAEQALRVIADMPRALLYRLLLFAEGVDLPLSTVIINTLISDWARYTAQGEVGITGPRMLHEYMSAKTPDGKRHAITGRDLFKALRDIYKQEIIDLRIAYLVEREKNAPLTEAESQFLIDNRAGRAWRDSPLYAEEQKTRAEIQKHIDSGDVEIIVDQEPNKS